MSSQEMNESGQTITELQSLLLTSVLRQTPLSGQSEPVHFPDLAFLTEAPAVLVSEDNVPGELALEGVDQAVEVVPESEIRDAARSGDRAYVRFQPAEQIDGRTRIRMEVRMAPREPEIPPLGLGAVSATFVRRPDGTWEVTEPPMGVAF